MQERSLKPTPEQKASLEVRKHDNYKAALTHDLHALRLLELWSNEGANKIGEAIEELEDTLAVAIQETPTYEEVLRSLK